MASSLFEIDARTKKRNASEKRFRFYGLTAIIIGLVFLFYLFWTITVAGASGFQQTRIHLTLSASAEEIEAAEKSVLKTSQYNKLLLRALKEKLDEAGITTDLSDGKLKNILSKRTGGDIRKIVLSGNGETVNASAFEGGIKFNALASADIDGYLKGRVTRKGVENNKNTSAAHLDLVDQMVAAKLIKKSFNWNFIFGTDSAEASPESAGFGASIVGSFAMMIVVLFMSLPIGVAASIYLEEFAPKNMLTDMIEVNISNLAAVPSIVFGILGLSLFINLPGIWLGEGYIQSTGWFRNNAPFIGGLVLTLRTLPTIIISTRAALNAVPPSIRDAALGVGASKMQTIFHHVLPLAMPGILTGTIIGLAQALGETAPLLLVGLIGYIGHTMPTDVTSLFAGPNTVMPAQIYTWTTRADPAWYEKAWAGIIILLVFLIAMNAIAIILRRRFERRW